MTGLDRNQTPKTRADAAEAHRAGGFARCRHQQDRLHDRAAEAVARRTTRCAAAAMPSN